MITGYDLINEYYEDDEKLYSTGNDDLDYLLERAFSDGYEFAQREFTLAKSDGSLVSSTGRVITPTKPLSKSPNAKRQWAQLNNRPKRIDPLKKSAGVLGSKTTTTTIPGINKVKYN